MKYLAATQGKVIVVDDADYEWLSAHSWCIQSKKYAASRVRGKLILMHRVITGAASGQYVDHINGNGLDNRRENLRICTQSQNMQNQLPIRHGTSKFKGVSWDKVNNKWRASICINKRQVNLGRYDSEIDAATVSNEFAIKHFGEFARINYAGKIY